MNDMLAHAGHSIEGKRAAVSGSGNVALYAIEKLGQLGAIPVTASDSGGFVHDPDGITGDRLDWLKDLKENRRGRISDYADEFGCDYHPDATPWSVPCDLAFPCATQNELGIDDARRLIGNGLLALAEGANMPTQIDAIHALQDANVLFAPGKAANAGGVAVSGLEQSQNSQRISWSRDEVDTRLRAIMKDIHDQCVDHGPTTTASTTSQAPTSPASPRSPTPCSPTDTSDSVIGSGARRAVGRIVYAFCARDPVRHSRLLARPRPSDRVAVAVLPEPSVAAPLNADGAGPRVRGPNTHPPWILGCFELETGR